MIVNRPVALVGYTIAARAEGGEGRAEPVTKSMRLRLPLVNWPLADSPVVTVLLESNTKSGEAALTV